MEIEKNTKLICPKCNDHIADFNQDVLEGDVISTDIFNWVNQEYGYQDKMECKKCGTPWAKYKELGFAIHTNKGWLP